MTFTAPPPLVLTPSRGFVVGVIGVAWSAEPSFEITGRAGRMHTAEVIGIAVRGEGLPRDLFTAALLGAVVRAPDGTLSRITGVESFCTVSQWTGAKIGVLLVPVSETAGGVEVQAPAVR